MNPTEHLLALSRPETHSFSREAAALAPRLETLKTTTPEFDLRDKEFIRCGDYLPEAGNILLQQITRFGNRAFQLIAQLVEQAEYPTPLIRLVFDKLTRDQQLLLFSALNPRLQEYCITLARGKDFSDFLRASSRPNFGFQLDAFLPPSLDLPPVD